MKLSIIDVKFFKISASRNRQSWNSILVRMSCCEVNKICTDLYTKLNLLLFCLISALAPRSAPEAGAHIIWLSNRKQKNGRVSFFRLVFPNYKYKGEIYVCGIPRIVLRYDVKMFLPKLFYTMNAYSRFRNIRNFTAISMN